MKPTNKQYVQLANAIRFLSMDAVEKANSGHPGMPMGMADVAAVLFAEFLKFNPSDPQWFNRDRFVLSAGHGSMLLYSLLYLTGYKDATIEAIQNFRQWGSPMAGHPEYGHLGGVETTTGPLGQGIATAVGMAIAERHLNATLKTDSGDEVINHKTFVIAGDGCLMEGISHEACALAGHLQLCNLIVLWDDNKITIDGAVELSDSTEQLMRFRSYNWHTFTVDGHDIDSIRDGIKWAMTADKPTLIACRTQIGKGAPNMQGTHKVHGSPLGKAEIEQARQALGWDYPPFVIPEEILNLWRKIGGRHRAEYNQWRRNHATGVKNINQPNKNAVNDALKQINQAFVNENANIATRVASQRVLGALVPVVDSMVGGSADLTGSNGTKPPIAQLANFYPNQYHGRYVNYGIREHAMVAALNGMALHGGIIPYAGTFMAFADYCRPAIRLGALMGLRAIYVMTHDSIGLGEDGPTHQPVEHLASLRAIPNLLVLRPADAIETAEAWAIALNNPNTPSVMVLTRQNLPLLRREFGENLSAKGAYILAGGMERNMTIIATGSEVHLAVKAREELIKKGIQCAVVSMPSMELFRKQSKKYQKMVLGSKPIIVVEAAISQGWHEFMGKRGVFIGMKSFGASAPYQELYRQFGINIENIIEKCEEIYANKP